MYLVDLLPAADVRVVDDDLAVKAARAEQGVVEHVEPVGAGEHLQCHGTVHQINAHASQRTTRH